MRLLLLLFLGIFLLILRADSRRQPPRRPLKRQEPSLKRVVPFLDEDDEDDEEPGAAVKAETIAAPASWPLKSSPAEPAVVSSNAEHVANTFLPPTTLAPVPIPVAPAPVPAPAPVEQSQPAQVVENKGPVTERPVADRPRGPLVMEEQLEDRFATKFTPDAENKVLFIEPEVLPNCWVQAMLSNKYHFAPQCNGDGTFAAKQCHQERCWCTNRDGSPQVKKATDRFYYEIRGITLRCVQNGVPV
ncbi:hypothetical protein BV898_17680 [Hypsibius exemplaris]|uniref:Thyroglobulin type-1 domain-containing protein n=1 Tax=Hypsibius exemplaris TaxID=2072580 RepID=A0A9X6NG24_HYPEX|nr:hypothetical protein BV898_17680 [Hypsibius exemplaris]